MTSPEARAGLRQAAEIRADAEMVGREFGPPEDCDWPPDAACARLADDAGLLLDALAAAEREAQQARNDMRKSTDLVSDGIRVKISLLKQREKLTAERDEARAQLADAQRTIGAVAELRDSILSALYASFSERTLTAFKQIDLLAASVPSPDTEHIWNVMSPATTCARCGWSVPLSSLGQLPSVSSPVTDTRKDAEHFIDLNGRCAACDPYPDTREETDREQ